MRAIFLSSDSQTATLGAMLAYHLGMGLRRAQCLLNCSLVLLLLKWSRFLMSWIIPRCILLSSNIPTASSYVTHNPYVNLQSNMLCWHQQNLINGNHQICRPHVGQSNNEFAPIVKMFNNICFIFKNSGEIFPNRRKAPNLLLDPNLIIN